MKKEIRTRSAALLCSLCLSLPVLGNTPVFAASSPEIIDLGSLDYYKGRTEKDVKQRWTKVLNERNGEKIYSVLPNASSAQKAAAGTIRPEAKQTIANYVNFNRWLAGMDELAIAPDSVWKNADEVCVVLQLNGTMSHYPEKPAGLNDEFYQRAYAGAQSSNLEYVRKSWVPNCFETLQDAKSAVDSWFDDNTNITSGRPVGHREMMLWRSQYPFAFGATNNCATFYRSSSWVEPTTNHGLAYAWPAPGPVPEEISDMTYWSVNLDPKSFDFVNSSGSAAVTIKELNSGKVLKSMSCSNLSDEYSYLNSGIGLSNGWYGESTLFFRGPENIHAGENYQVEITGLKRSSNGAPVTLRYTVSPFGADQVMHRLYNPNSGEHFYTADEHEKNVLIGYGWKDEGIGWIAPKSSSTPVYRLYNANAGDHHYTMNTNERNNLIRAGWNDEGIGWYSDDSRTVPLYRQYNPNAKAGSHNYTVNKKENDYLVSNGWRYEGISWYAVSAGK